MPQLPAQASHDINAKPLNTLRRTYAACGLPVNAGNRLDGRIAPCVKACLDRLAEGCLIGDVRHKLR
jgi:hypothetical protein